MHIRIVFFTFFYSLTLFYDEFWSGTGVVFRTVFSQKYHNKMKEILKVEETNSESQIVIQAAKYGNLLSNLPKCKFSSNLVFEFKNELLR